MFYPSETRIAAHTIQEKYFDFTVHIFKPLQNQATFSSPHFNY